MIATPAMTPIQAAIMSIRDRSPGKNGFSLVSIFAPVVHGRQPLYPGERTAGHIVCPALNPAAQRDLTTHVGRQKSMARCWMPVKVSPLFPTFGAQPAEHPMPSDHNKNLP
jgi:hypothetical protein